MLAACSVRSDAPLVTSIASSQNISPMHRLHQVGDTARALHWFHRLSKKFHVDVDHYNMRPGGWDVPFSDTCTRTLLSGCPVWKPVVWGSPARTPRQEGPGRLLKHILTSPGLKRICNSIRRVYQSRIKSLHYIFGQVKRWEMQMPQE